MGNVLDPQKQQQVMALGRLGWSLRRIEQATGVRRETISGYLRTAGVAVRGRAKRRQSRPFRPRRCPPTPRPRRLSSTGKIAGCARVQEGMEAHDILRPRARGSVENRP